MRLHAQSNPGLGLLTNSGCNGTAGSGPGSPSVGSGGVAGAPAPSVPPTDSSGVLLFPPAGASGAGGAAA